MNDEDHLTIKTRPELRCQNRYKKFSESHCLLSISVGQPAHESLKFSATIELINEQFKQCTICLGDTLQRFTLAMESKSSPEDLFDYARKLGDEWIERNAARYSLLTIPYSIVRWSTYLIHPDFKRIKSKILDLYQSDRSCQQAFISASGLFMARYLKKHDNHPPVSIAAAKRYCFEYLLEESTVMCLWAQEKYDYDVYPGRRNAAMEFIHKKMIQPVCPNAITSVFIKSINFMY